MNDVNPAGAAVRAGWRVLSLVLFITVLLPYSSSVLATSPGASARGYAVYDSLTGRFIEQSNGDAVLKMASTTKIMTALIAIENFPLDQTVTFSREMTAIGSSMYLQYGEKVTVENLLYGLMLMSGNDAARALASLADGGEAGFVRLMNAKAASLELKNTHFENPNGLDGDTHYTTAKELALLTAYAMQNDTFRRIVSTKSGVFAGRQMTNHNRLLSSIEGCIGVKTGYTMSAGRCLVSAVNRAGRDIIVVTLGASNDWRDHTALHAWAAKNYPICDVIIESQTIATLSVTGGSASTVTLYADRAVTLGLSNDELSRIETTQIAPQIVYAPINAGDTAGHAVISLDGKELARVELLYSDSIALNNARVLSVSEIITDFFETLAWRLGICYNAR